jgi:hypothetical protein
MKLSAIKVSSRHLVLVIRGHCHRRPNAYTLLLVTGVMWPRHPVPQYPEPSRQFGDPQPEPGLLVGILGAASPQSRASSWLRPEPGPPMRLVRLERKPPQPDKWRDQCAAEGQDNPVILTISPA